jgi:acetolactate synthase-1/2/3 large subunit
VVLLSGDGGFLFNCQELATAVHFGVPLVMVVFNDSGYGVLRPQQMARYGRTHAADLVSPDFVAMARAFGARAVRVETFRDLGRELSKALKESEPCLIEVVAQVPWPPIETTAGLFAQADVVTG